MPYPEGVPALRSGDTYKLIVATNDVRSDEEGGLGLGFSLVTLREQEMIRSEEARIRELGLAPGPTQFLVAYLYASHELNAEGIALLEQLSKTFEEPAVARLTGDLYQTVGLASRAELWYSTALERSSTVNDEEGQTLAHQSLARVYETGLGNFKYAVEHLSAALRLAEKTGDEHRTAEIRQKLKELQRPK